MTKQSESSESPLSLCAERKVWGPEELQACSTDMHLCPFPPPLSDSIPHLSPTVGLSVPPSFLFLLFLWNTLSLWSVCPASVSEARIRSVGSDRAQLPQRLRVLGKTALRPHPQQKIARLGGDAHSRHAHFTQQQPWGIPNCTGNWHK